MCGWWVSGQSEFLVQADVGWKMPLKAVLVVGVGKKVRMAYLAVAARLTLGLAAVAAIPAAVAVIGLIPVMAVAADPIMQGLIRLILKACGKVTDK